jgi:hypothetical protein
MLSADYFLIHLKTKASTWYFSLAQASITSWNSFETTFIEKFGEKRPQQL